MRPFELARPDTLAEATGLLAERSGEALALAGGQDLLALLKDDVLQPARLVNLKSVPAVGSISVGPDGSLTLGPLATLTELAESEAVRNGWPTIAKAAAMAATPQIRNLGTVGGNLCQKPRCWYYRAGPLRCARKGGDTCLAVAGDHRYHSIFTYGDCISPSYSSLATPLTALAAMVEIQGPAESRKIPISELYTALRDDVTADSSLGPDEIITGLTVPSAAGWAAAHQEVRHRASHDWPLAMTTVALRLDGAEVAEARVVLGAVAPVPWLSAPAAEALVGQQVTEPVATRAADLAVAEATPLQQNAYKVTLTRNLVRRTILAAVGRGEG